MELYHPILKKTITTDARAARVLQKSGWELVEPGTQLEEDAAEGTTHADVTEEASEAMDALVDAVETGTIRERDEHGRFLPRD